MGVGQVLLRLLYRYTPVPSSYYDASARLSCSTIVVDVGGGTGLLYNALVKHCNPSYYIVLEVDASLASSAERGPGVDVVVGDARRPPLRRIRGAVLVFNDSLHHIGGWREAVCRMLEPGECITIHDFDRGSWRGRLLVLFERLLGFPAEFTTLAELEALLAGCGFHAHRVEYDGFVFTVRACRARDRGV